VGFGITPAQKSEHYKDLGTRQENNKNFRAAGLTIIPQRIRDPVHG